MAQHRPPPPPPPPPPPSPRRIPLDVHGAADYLGVSVRQVRNLVFQRQLTHVKVGALVRFEPDALDAYLARNTRQATG